LPSYFSFMEQMLMLMLINVLMHARYAMNSVWTLARQMADGMII